MSIGMLLTDGLSIDTVDRCLSVVDRFCRSVSFPRDHFRRCWLCSANGGFFLSYLVDLGSARHRLSSIGVACAVLCTIILYEPVGVCGSEQELANRQKPSQAEPATRSDGQPWQPRGPVDCSFTPWSNCSLGRGLFRRRRRVTGRQELLRQFFDVSSTRFPRPSSHPPDDGVSPAYP